MPSGTEQSVCTSEPTQQQCHGQKTATESHACHVSVGSHLELHWLNPPRKILVVAKPSPDVLRSLVKVAEWLLDPQRAMHVYVEPSVYARLGLVSCF